MHGDARELPICGVWIDDFGRAHVSLAIDGGGRTEALAEFQPFAWLRSVPADLPNGIEIRSLTGPGVYRHLALSRSVPIYEELLATVGSDNYESLRPLESQFLLQKRRRLFAGLRFADRYSKWERIRWSVRVYAAPAGGRMTPTACGVRSY